MAENFEEQKVTEQKNYLASYGIKGEIRIGEDGNGNYIVSFPCNSRDQELLTNLRKIRGIAEQYNKDNKGKGISGNTTIGFAAGGCTLTIPIETLDGLVDGYRASKGKSSDVSLDALEVSKYALPSVTLDTSPTANRYLPNLTSSSSFIG